MAVKVKIEKKRPTLKVEEYAQPGDRSSRQMAYISFVVILLFLLGIGTFNIVGKSSPNWYVAGVLIAWALIPWWIYFINLPRRYRSKIGLKNRVMPTHRPEIREHVAQQCKILAIRDPEVFLIEGESGWIHTFNAGRPFIVFTKPLLTILKPAEFSCALLQELGRIKSGHARAVTLLYFLEKTPRFLRGIFAMPVWFLGFLLWQSWEDAGEATVDRLLVILTRNARLCASTILKLAIESGDVKNVSPEEVEDYLKQQDPVKATSLEVSAHFKMGATVHEDPELHERLKALVAFSQSKEYKELLGKMDEVLAALKV